MAQKYFRDLLIFLATIDPFTTLSVFIAVTAGYEPAKRKKVALRSIVFATGVLVAAVAVGQVVLTAMHVRLASFQIAGGIVLFLFGVQMIFGVGHSEHADDPNQDVAVFPMATPTIAGPGAILASIMLTDNDINTIDIQIGSVVVLLAVLALNYLAMLGATWLARIIGTGGIQILRRIMGLILTALAVESVLHGISLIVGAAAS